MDNKSKLAAVRLDQVRAGLKAAANHAGLATVDAWDSAPRSEQRMVSETALALAKASIAVEAAALVVRDAALTTTDAPSMSGLTRARILDDLQDALGDVTLSRHRLETAFDLVESGKREESAVAIAIEATASLYSAAERALTAFRRTLKAPHDA